MKPSEALRPWTELYSAAEEFHSLAPWRWMVDSEIFGVRDPETGTIGWCCVLGAGGQLSGLVVYRGDTGFESHRLLQRGELRPDEALFGQDAFVLTFVDRADMSKAELQRLRSLGLSFRGRGRWPQIESHAVGRLPLPLGDAEAERMLHSLREATHIVRAVREVPRCIEPDPEGRLLVRTLRDREWQAERVAPPAPIQVPIPGFDAVHAERVKRKLKPSRAILECDLCPLPIVIEERKGHPYSPAMIFLVDSASGAILHQEMGTPEDRHRMAQAEFLAGLERLGIAPATVRVRRPSLARVLAPVGAALGIEISLVEKLPIMEEVQAQATEFFQRVPARRGPR